MILSSALSVCVMFISTDLLLVRCLVCPVGYAVSMSAVSLSQARLLKWM